MELLCPECLGPLESKDGKTARCAVHGGQYRVLYVRPGAAPAQAVPRAAPPGVAAFLDGLSSGLPPRLPGHQCSNHANVPAAYRCRYCARPICETCAFKFPGNIVACPACATSPANQSSPKRRNYLIGSFVCAVLASLLIMVMFGAFAAGPQPRHDAEVFAGFVVILVLALTIAGTGLGVGARPPSQPASVGVWLAIGWNGMLLAGMVLLCVAGTFMRL